jgi:hypothetical protein
VPLWAVSVAAVGAFVLLRPSWFVASVMVVLAIPKFVYYDVSYLLVGADVALQDNQYVRSKVAPAGDRAKLRAP